MALISKNKQANHELLLFEAAKSGNLEQVKISIKCGANLDAGLMGACQGDNNSILKYIIKAGANWWNGGLQYAAKGGNISIMKNMIYRGADDFNLAFIGACSSNSIEAVKFLVECYKSKLSLKYGLRQACAVGNTEIALYIIDQGIINLDDLFENVNDSRNEDFTNTMKIIAEKLGY